jgi:hypothetical protein
MAGIPGLEYSMATAQHIGRGQAVAPAALDAVAIFAPRVTTPAWRFPRRRSLRGTRIPLLFTVVLLVGCPLRRDRVAGVVR